MTVRDVKGAVSRGHVGAPTPRLDGPLKVSGQARYAAEVSHPGLAHAVLVQSTIASGRILYCDKSAALSAPGVIAVLTHEDMPRFGTLPDYYPVFGLLWAAQSHLPMQDDQIAHNGQHVAIVVADTFEAARYAVTLVGISYDETPAATDFQRALASAGNAGDYPQAWELCRRPPAAPVAARSDISPPHELIGEGPDDSRGDVDAGLRAAEVTVDSRFVTPAHHHNAMELHSVVAAWNGNELTLHDSTNAVFGAQNVVARAMNVPVTGVHVIAPFVGGSFGCKGRVWPHEILAAAAARVVGRPIKLVLTRPQTYTSAGHRAPVSQRVRLGAMRDGTLTAIVHNSIQESWPFETFAEPTGTFSRVMYSCPNFAMTHRVVKVHAPKANMTHSPGDLVGSFGLEVAMDELAAKLGMDPVELRLSNHADEDQQLGLPYSSKMLRECYALGADRFGWSRRDPKPRSMRHRDGALMGWGMASTSYNANIRQAARVNAKLHSDGSVSISAGASDQGAGTYTALALIAADELKIPVSRIRVELGDSRFPHAPPQVGALIIESVGPAVLNATQELIAKLKAMAASAPGSPMLGAEPEGINVVAGGLALHDNPNVRLGWADVLGLARNPFSEVYDVEAIGEATPVPPGGQTHSAYSFGALFCEVHVDPDLGKARVTRFTAALGCGRIINPVTARNQVLGGITWAIGHALMEGTTMDPPTGRYVNGNLGDYHIAGHADIPVPEVIFVPEDDTVFNPTGAKTLGEIAVVGSSAAVANAVAHATGLRITGLPLTPDKLMF